MPTAKTPKHVSKHPKVRHLTPIPGGKAARIESKYEALFEQASDAIVTVHADGKVDAANRAAEELTGFLKSELVGAGISRLVPNAANTKDFSRSRPVTDEMFQTEGTFEDIAIARKDGYIRFVELSVRRVKSDGESLSLVLFRDVTEKKGMERDLITKHAELRNAYFQLEKKNAEAQAMQETLVQSGKMAALGELAAGIAHELNQPLQGIRGYAQELQAIIAAPDPAQAGAMHEIISNVDKMATIIDYLRTFTRKSTEQYEETDVHYAIEESLKMLARQFSSRGVVVHRSFSKNLPKVYGNPLQLEQVFINLATNARDAIEETGRGSGNLWITTRDAGNFIEIDFRDDGKGMSDRTKSKVFNPFFTTKEVGRGMGLGLSLSYGILAKIHGSMVVESELGKGAKFLIRVPKDFRELA